MTTLYVSSVDGVNTDSGLSWALAKQTVAGALAIAVDNDVILVDSAHNFVAGAAITWTPPTGRIQVISVNRAGGDAWLPGATENVGALAAAFVIAGAANSAMFLFGISIIGSNVSSVAATITLLNTPGVSTTLDLKSCTINLASPNLNALLGIGVPSSGTGRAAKITATDCTFVCSGSRLGNFINLSRTVLELINPTFSITGATKPTSLFAASAIADSPALTIRDGDISGYNVSGGVLFVLTNFNAAKLVLENLRLSTVPTIASGVWPFAGDLTSRNVASGDVITAYEYRNAFGILTSSTNIYSDAAFAGVGVSWQVVTTAACNEASPFILPPMTYWLNAASTVAVACDVIHDSATALTDRELWLEVSYPSSAAFPIYSVASDRNAFPYTGTAANQATNSVTWTGTGGFAAPIRQEAAVTITAAEIGLLRGRVVVARPNKTLYVNPALRVT